MTNKPNISFAVSRIYQFILLLIISGGISLQAQVIRTHVIEKPTGEEIGWCNSFIIDPVDSMTVGFGESDFNGETKYELVRPLKSRQFLLKFCDPYQRDTMFQFAYEKGKKYEIELTPVKQILLMTVYFNETKIVHYDYRIDPYHCFGSYYRSYDSLMNYKIHLEQEKYDQEYEKEYADYLRTLEWIEAASKDNPDIAYELPMAPQKMEYPVMPVYVITSQQPEFPGGIEEFFKRVYELRSMQKQWRRKKNMDFDFKLRGFEFQADTLVVYDDRNKTLKNSDAIWKEIKPLMQTKWKPMKLNGRAVRLRQDVVYRIEFIYRKE